MKFSLNKNAAAVAAAMAALLAMPSAHADGLSLKGAEVYGAVGTSDMGYTDSGLALRVGVDSAPIVPMGQVNIGATAFYTYTSSTYKYAFYSDCEWKYSSHVFSGGPTLNLPLQSTRLTFQGRLVGSYGLLRSSGSCGGYTYSYTADSGSSIHVGLGVGVKYQLNDKIVLRADWDDWGYSSLAIGVGMKF